MKKPEEYLFKIERQTNYSIRDAIIEAQKEAYNQAINRGAWFLDKESILKLKIK